MAVAAVLSLIVIPLFAPAQETRSTSVTLQYEYKPQTPPPTNGLTMRFPSVGLFIGVSDYGEKAKVTSTPAHSLGAAVMYEAFLGAATYADNKSLDIPLDNYLSGGTDAICALAFSPDQSYFVSSSRDGTVTVWSGKELGKVLNSTRHKANPCALAISPDSSQIIVGGSEEDPVIQSIQADKPLVTLKHPAGVCSAAFSPDGNRVLTTSRDGATRIWDVAGDREPLVLQSDEKCPSANAQKDPCADAPVAAFNSDGHFVATSRCNTVRLWNLDKPAEPVLLGEDSSPVHGLLFRPDDSQLMSATENGVALWALNKTDSQQSPPSDGHPVSRAFEGAPLRSLQLSQDGHYALFSALDGNAWMQEMHGGHLTVLPRLDRDFETTFTIKFAIDQGLVPTFRSRAKIEAVALSPDARYVVAGYDNGFIGIHPGTKTPGQRPFLPGNQRLLADLRFDHSPTSIMAIWYLEELHGAIQQFDYEAPKGQPDDGDNPTNLRLGDGEPVTRERIFSALSDAIQSAEQTAEQQRFAVLVLYVAAHGWIGADNRQYFLPADADATRPETWIAFDDFLSPVKAFLATSPPAGAQDDSPQRAAIVIFDTCQTRLASSQSEPTESSIENSKDLFVIEATSPGQYAWHWTGNLNSTESTTTVKSTKKLGVTHTDQPDNAKTKSDYASRMSMFPYASQVALNAFIRDRHSQAKPDDRIVSLNAWIATTQKAIQMLQKDIPEVAQTGQDQTVRVRNPKMDIDLFEVENNVPPQ